MDAFTLPPTTWDQTDVVAWAEQARLAPETISALAQNHVDGPTLVTLTQTELQSELNIASLPARRYLWELIKGLQSEQETTDYSKAIQVHEEEIQVFAFSETASWNIGGPDTEGSVNASNLSAVVGELASDAQRQRELLEDHMIAHRMQRAMKLGQQFYEDAEAARDEQVRLNQLMAQAEHDRQFAESLATGTERRSINRCRRQEHQAGASNNPVNFAGGEEQQRFASLFGLCVQACSENKVNVADAFKAGKVKPIAITQANIAEISDDDDRKPAAIRKPVPDTQFDEEDLHQYAAAQAIESLPYIEQCHGCFEEYKKGYSLACGHLQCIGCMRKFFRTALRDASLLPLRCCEVPIDMNIAAHLLPRAEATTIIRRVEELEAKNKMYCLSCSAFVNLDFVDTTFATDLLCSCGMAICVVCKTAAHPGTTCIENTSGIERSDEAVLQLSRELGWKQCPGCSSIIELRSGCNHMTCSSCRYEFCFNCLQQWSTNNAQCSSGQCELWDEDRLLEAGEARVQQEEAALGGALPQVARRERLRHAVAGLRANEICDHDWIHSQGYKGECPNCDFKMFAYGMRCISECGSTVCSTCAHHRIPRRGWR